MFGKKIVSILIFVILILLAGNVLAVTPADVKVDYEETPIHYDNTVSEIFIVCMIINYIVSIINSFILILNKHKVDKKYFRNILILTIILVIGNYTISVILENYSREISYRVDKRKYYMPVFVLILQIIISISIILKLRKGKNQPKCEKV